jgi:hypothetical protein
MKPTRKHGLLSRTLSDRIDVLIPNEAKEGYYMYSTMIADVSHDRLQFTGVDE